MGALTKRCGCGMLQPEDACVHLPGIPASVRDVAFSPDGRMLASGSRDETVRLWDLVTGKHLRTLVVHVDSSGDSAFNPAGTVPSSASENRSERPQDAGTGGHIEMLVHTVVVDSVAFSPDGKTLAGGTLEGICLWDTVTWKHQRMLDMHAVPVTSLAFSPDGRILAGRRGMKIHLWGMPSRKHLRTLTGHLNPVVDLAFSPDGSVLASGSQDATVLLWDFSQIAAGNWSCQFDYDKHNLTDQASV